jgi:hypothetical protein
VEAVVINWKRPRNVAAIVSALRRQTIPCTITVCDCHDSLEFELPLDTLPSIDRIYSWPHNSGAFSRYVPVGGYDHKYTLFIDDDMLPGVRCVEHFLTWAEQLRAFGALGQLGRILDSDGSYQPQDVARGPGFTEVDILVRAFFVRTDCLVHVPQIRNLLREFSDPEDDILLSVGLAMYAGLACYLTPADPDPQTLVNIYELDTPYSRSTRPHHLAARSRLLHSAMNLGWRPVRSRQQSEPVNVRSAGSAEHSSGVLYLAIGDEYRTMTIASISSLRRYGYRGPIRVVTDKHGWIPSRFGCESTVVPNAGDGLASRYYKTQLFRFAYDVTLFLDSDAIPVGNIDDIWEFLDDSSLAMAADMQPNIGDLIANDRDNEWWQERWGNEGELMIRLGLTSRAFFNSGVMLFRRSDAVAALFASWHEEWKRFRKRDQMALARATALSAATVRTLPRKWNCPAEYFTSIREAQQAGVKVLHFLSSNRRFMTAELLSALSNDAEYPAGGDWERWNLRDRGRLRAGINGSRSRSRERGRGGGFLTHAVIGATRNLEMVIPGQSGGIANYWRKHPMRSDSWSGPVVLGEGWGEAASASLIQGNLGDHGNLEMVIRAGSRLGHYWREPAPNQQWQGAKWFAEGAAGNPSLIQSDYGKIGNFELVVPCISGGVAYCWRNNDDVAEPWIEGEIFALELGRVDSVALIQSTLGKDRNLEVIARVGGELAHYWRSPQGRAWHGPAFFFSGAAGIPGFIQSRKEEPGNFELLTPVQDGGMAHLRRDNSGPHRRWKISSYIDRDGAPAEAVSLIRGSDGNSRRSDLEAVVRCGDGVKWYWHQDGQSGKWSCVRLW